MYKMYSKIIFYYANRTKCNNKGFTLIELLVVVLIIGILAAVALPQYTIAVEKSRAAEALVVLRNLREAQELYYLANGSYCPDLSELDIEAPQSNNWEYSWSADMSVVADRKNMPEDKQYLLAYRTNNYTSQGAAFVVCGYDIAQSADFAERICKALGATQKESAKRWILNQ